MVAKKQEEGASECAPRTAPDACTFVKESGKCEYDRLDYLGFHYCTVMKKYKFPGWTSMLVLGPWMVLLFCAIGQVHEAVHSSPISVCRWT